MRTLLGSDIADALRKPVLLPVEPVQMKRVVLDKPTCVVGGNRASVHLPLPSQAVSKAHALIVNDQDCVYIRDLASRNHTYVNDAPVREAPLAESDVVRIGNFAFRCGPGFQKGRAPVLYQVDRGILYVDGDGNVPISQRTILIGGRSDCEIRLRGEDVAPVHAVVFERDGKRYIRDLHSGTGTFVNGQRVLHERELKPDDEIRIAGIPIRYALAEPDIETSDETLHDGILDAVEEDGLIPIAETSAAAEPPPESADAPTNSTAGEPAPPSATVANADDEQKLPVFAEELELKDDSFAGAPMPAGAVDAVEPAIPSSPDYDALIAIAQEDDPQEPASDEGGAAKATAAAAAQDQGNAIAVRGEGSPQAKTVLEPIESEEGSERAEAREAPPDSAGVPSIAVNVETPTQSVRVEVPVEPLDPVVAADEPPDPEKITHLVGEVADKALELESAWRDYHESSKPQSPHPGAQDAGNREEPKRGSPDEVRSKRDESFRLP